MISRFVVLTAVALAGTPASVVVVEQPSPALDKTKVTEPIGIETPGGVFTQILPAGCKLPCSKTEVFSTASDSQTELRVFLFRGRARRAKENHSLGVFVVRGWAPAPRGVPEIAVSFTATEDRIVLSVSDRKAGLPLTIVRAKENK